MELNLDPVLIINTVLCIIIFILGVTSTGKSRNIILLIAWAFGIFAVSHILQILNLSHKFELFQIVIRFLAYLLILIGIAGLRKK
ncbi:MAG: hypothetical protein APR54_04230 [Candidatus Cloacimonas sp. SDB]|nr:MAG: hypothetical protein APR54_04230 [Candidatus Cloacimonas sp. SDB]